jgi:hypothetical protein
MHGPCWLPCAPPAVRLTQDRIEALADEADEGLQVKGPVDDNLALALLVQRPQQRCRRVGVGAGPIGRQQRLAQVAVGVGACEVAEGLSGLR